MKDQQIFQLPESNLAERRGHQPLAPIITYMSGALASFWPKPLGPPHPRFPRTMLAYHLLTEAELNSIASYYHQRPLTPRAAKVVFNNESGATYNTIIFTELESNAVASASYETNSIGSIVDSNQTVVPGDTLASIENIMAANQWADISNIQDSWLDGVTATQTITLRLQCEEAFPSLWTYAYPVIMDWDEDFFEYMGKSYGDVNRVNIKRRKLGCFLGISGCLTPEFEAEEREHFRRRMDNIHAKGAHEFFGRSGYGGF